jgi:hypothetical protein
MRENGLRETPEHSVYSLRHSFEDRLLDRDVDERIRRDLMGHALTCPSSEFSGMLRPFCNGGSGSVSVQV